MMILGLDPSSTRTGYALMSSPTWIVEAGYLRPHRTKDPALMRVSHMRESLVDILGQYGPAIACVEVPSGKVASGQRRGASASAMAMYGMAVGVFLATCLEHLRGEVVTPNEREWTRGVPKIKRNRLIAAQFPVYREQFSKDSGGDIGDAIGLALWAYRNETVGCKLQEPYALLPSVEP